ncbi:MAG: hypothetical protein FJ027_23005 [Candidatus Rokubacteria bacterium]|nr:hypothetical protein [Candidatus Rokubacteria bacterium]
MTMRVCASARRLFRGCVMVFLVCLLSDMAMPLLPGAFRLSPNESIDATASRPVTVPEVVPPVVPPHAATRTVAARAAPARSAPTDALHRAEVSTLRGLPRASTPGDSARASDDD